MIGKKIRSSMIKKETESSGFNSIVHTPDEIILTNNVFLEGIVKYFVAQQGRCANCGSVEHKTHEHGGEE